MILGIMQPYLFPYIGYWQLIHVVDKFVIYDDVNFIKGGWINRNNILIQNKEHLFTIKLDHSSPNKLIREIFIKDDFVKLLKTISSVYSKAPYFDQTVELLIRIFEHEDKRLSKFTTNSILEISKYLNLNTEFILSSELPKDCSLKKQEKVINICSLLQTKTYINSIGGKELYEKETFAKNNIELKFLKPNSITYKQFDNKFTPWLSVIDIMMFNSKEEIKVLLDNYQLT
jgi:hypothetical protein